MRKREEELTEQDRKLCPEHRTREAGPLETWVPWAHFWQRPPDKKPFWFITAPQEAVDQVAGCDFHEACDQFNTILLAFSALGFHLVTSLDTTEVEICVTFLQVLLFTHTKKTHIILHSLATVQQCFRTRKKAWEI